MCVQNEMTFLEFREHFLPKTGDVSCTQTFGYIISVRTTHCPAKSKHEVLFGKPSWKERKILSIHTKTQRKNIFSWDFLRKCNRLHIRRHSNEINMGCTAQKNPSTHNKILILHRFSADQIGKNKYFFGWGALKVNIRLLINDNNIVLGEPTQIVLLCLISQFLCIKTPIIDISIWTLFAQERDGCHTDTQCSRRIGHSCK